MLYAELDDLEAQIAEAQARQNPHNQSLGERAAEARATAIESAHVVSPALDEPAKDCFNPGDDIKKLYREIARQIPPGPRNG